MAQQHPFNDLSLDWGSFEFPSHEGGIGDGNGDGDDCSSHCDECYSDCGAPGPGDICRESGCALPCNPDDCNTGCALPCNPDDCNTGCNDSACLDRGWAPVSPLSMEQHPSLSSQYHAQQHSGDGVAFAPTMGHTQYEYGANWQSQLDLMSLGDLNSLPYDYSFNMALDFSGNAAPAPYEQFNNFRPDISTASSVPPTPSTPSGPLTPSASPTPSTPMVAGGDAGLHVCNWIGDSGICGEVFVDANLLHDHCREQHTKNLRKRQNVNSPAGYKCFWAGCNRGGGEFPQKSKLERHLQTHTGFKPYQCPVCNLALSAKQSLAQHLRTHTGEKPFRCEYEGCQQAFRQQSALTMHERSHTGEKPLVCNICGKHFSESTNLTKHRRTHDNRRHECATCGHKFCRLDQLKRHERTQHQHN